MSETTHPNLINAVRTYIAKSARERGSLTNDDICAWEEFYERYSVILVRFAHRLRFQTQEVDDLLQEVWTDILKRLPEFEYDASTGGFRRWLFTIVRRRAIDHGRLRLRRLHKTSSVIGELVDKESISPSEVLDRHFKVEVVQAAIEAFRGRASPSAWEIFNLCRLQGRTCAIAAQELGITPEAARQRLARATHDFRRSITDLVGDATEG